MSFKPPQITLLAWTALTLALHAAPIPLDLPKPDGKPGNPKKPVKVYMLAGQSNMVGFAALDPGPPLSNVYLSADPALIPGIYPYEHPSELKYLFGVNVDKLRLNDVKLEAKTLTAQLEVPKTGIYQAHAGTGASSANVITIAGKEVTRKETGGQPVMEKIPLEVGKSYPVKIEFSTETSKVFWLEEVDMKGKGDLTTLTRKDGKFLHLVDDKGAWTLRHDVLYTDPRLSATPATFPLSPTANNGRTFGPELGFGSVIGTFHDEQVLLIKSAIGNRSLAWDYRPPSSGYSVPENTFEGYEYRALVKNVRDTLARIDQVVPGYSGQGYEIAGFCWFQGHKDADSTKEAYEKNLVNLIQDLRKEFNTPKMPAVVATVGFLGYPLASSWQGVWEAQMAVGDPKQHPEFAGTVASVDTRDFWRDSEESPKNQYYHYNWNAETYLLVGEAMGRAMVRLQGGEAESIPKSDREAKAAAKAAITKPTTEQLAAHQLALRPIILEGALANYLRSESTKMKLAPILAGEKPANGVMALDDVMNCVAVYYHAAGINDHDWKPFAVQTGTAKWDYFGIDLPGSKPKPQAQASAAEEEQDDANEATAPEKKKAKENVKTPPPAIVLPAQMANWFAPDFDAAKAGWKSGTGPFGEAAPAEISEKTAEWLQKRKRVRTAPATLTDKDVLLLRQTFDLPAAKPGHRYRIRIEGSAHNNMGEGYAIYINGKLLAETREGITAYHRQVYTTRGAAIPPEFLNEFKGGKVTIAVANYPLYGVAAERTYPPGRPLAIHLEEQKLPTP
ncbi:MAG TPA: sialate O-acetylesterase [Luteolibacter sp.]|nr:sialate O-acetylesterase [Luteolibacter sp.]